MKITVTVKGNDLMPGAGVQETDEVQRVEIDLGDAGHFTITPEEDGICVWASHGPLAIILRSGDTIALQSRRGW